MISVGLFPYKAYVTILSNTVYLQHDVHHQEHLEEVLSIVDVAEAAGCEAVCVAEEQQQEHSPDGEVDMAPVGSFHEPNDVAHQRVGERVDSRHDVVEEIVARQPA